MAYFPNGTSGMRYQEQFCENCWNYRDLNDGRGHGCPIWDLHYQENYDQFGKNDASKAVNRILDHFIPTKKDGFPDKCVMFLAKNEFDIKGQMKLFETEVNK